MQKPKLKGTLGSEHSPSRLERAEWDFRARPNVGRKVGEPKRATKKTLDREQTEKFERFNFLPDDQVLACHTYELARHDARHADEIRAWRGKPEQSFDELLSLWEKRITEMRQPPHEFYVYWPDWPVTPFLKVPEDERRKRWKKWAGRTFDARPALPSVSFRYLFAHHESLDANPKPKWLSGEFRHAQIDPKGGVITFGGEGPLSKIEYAAFKIHYWKSDAVLADEFESWLKARRAENGIPNPKTGGEKSPVSRHRKELLTLGVWRLKTLGRMTSEQAIAYTEEVSGRPLFATASTWSENFRRATSPCGVAWLFRTSF